MLNLPNALTLLRVIVCPVIVLSILKDWKILSFILILTAGISDLLDGFVARRLKQTTSLGTILDPTADKVLILCIVLSAIFKKKIPIWVGSVFIGKDFLISTGVLTLYAIGKKPQIKPTMAGKAAIFMEGSYLVILFLSEIFSPHQFIVSIAQILAMLAVLACTIAPFTYIPHLIKTVKEKDQNRILENGKI